MADDGRQFIFPSWCMAFENFGGDIDIDVHFASFSASQSSSCIFSAASHKRLISIIFTLKSIRCCLVLPRHLFYLDDDYLTNSHKAHIPGIDIDDD